MIIIILVYYLINLTSTEVYRALIELDPKKGARPGNIPPLLLKIMLSILPTLCIFCTTSLYLLNIIVTNGNRLLLLLFIKVDQRIMLLIT